MKRINTRKVLLVCVAACFLVTFATADVVAYWPFGVHGLSDVSGNGHTLVKGAAGVSLTNGLARLDGNQTQFSSEFPLDLSGYSNLTVEFWMRAAATVNTGIILEHTENFAENSGAFYIDVSEESQGNIIGGFRSSGWYNLDETLTGVATDSEWHHVAIVYDASKAGADRSVLYFDRLAQPTWQNFSADDAMAFRNAYLYLGSRANSAFQFIGDLDDIRISNVVLEPSEFLQSRSDEDADARVVAYWPFDRGSELADASGHGNALAPSSGVVFSNSVAVLDGSQTAFHTIDTLDLTTYSNLTIECFLRTIVGDGTSMVLEHSANATNTPGAFALSLTGGTAIGGFRMDDGANYDTSNIGTELTDGLWHHVALVYETAATGAARVRLYVDRIRQTPSAVYTNDVLAAFRDEILYIGSRANGETPFIGELDDVRIVDAALTTNYFLKAPSDGPPKVIAYWPFTRGYEGVDASGHGFTLTQRLVTDVDVKDGRAIFKGRSGLYTTTRLDLSSFKAVTIEGFFKTSATNADPVLAEMSLDYNGSLGNFVISTGMLLKDTMGAGYRTSDGFNIECAPKDAINDGAWHHIAYVIDLNATNSADLTRLFLDGQRQVKSAGLESATATPFASGQSLYLGWRGSSPGLGFIGEMDDFRITAAALRTNEFLSPSDRTTDPAANAVIAFWPFDTANGLADASGNGNTLTGSGVAFTDGAAVFGGSQTLQTANTLNLSGYSAVTIEYFIRSKPQPVQIVLEQSVNYGALAGAFIFYVAERSTGALTAGYNTGAGANLDVTSPGSVSDDRWHHIALVIDLSKSGADRAQLYLDSVRQPKYFRGPGPHDFYDYANLAPLLDDTLYFGSRNNDALKFVGQLDDIRITGKALTRAEFLTRPTVVRPPVIAYWPFAQGRELQDASGNDNLLANLGVTFNATAGAAVFDGDQTAFGTAANLNLRLHDALTIECFVKSTATTNQQILLELSPDAPVTQGAFSLLTPANSVMVESAFTTAAYNYYQLWNYHYYLTPAYRYNIDRCNAGNSVMDGEWHHLALVIDSAKPGADRAKLYFDRVPQSDIANFGSDFATAFLNAPFFIGSRANSGDKFAGELDDIRITGAALTPAQFLARRSVPQGTLLMIQ